MVRELAWVPELLSLPRHLRGGTDPENPCHLPTIDFKLENAMEQPRR